MTNMTSFLKAVLFAVLLVLSFPTTVLNACVALLVRLVSPTGRFTRWLEIKVFHLQQGWSVLLLQYIAGTKLVLHEDAAKLADGPTENILIVSNHPSAVDWSTVGMAFMKTDTFAHCRMLAKHTMRYWPGFGWNFYAYRALFVNRFDFDEGKMISDLQVSKDFEYVSYAVTPEGSRYNPINKLLIEKGKQYAKNRNLTPLQHLLTPRARGTWLILKTLRDRFDAVYDVTMFYEHSVDEQGNHVAAPNIFGFALNSSNVQHVRIKRIPIAEVPQEESEFEKWMYDMFLEKDKFLQQFYGKETTQHSEKTKCWTLPFTTFIPAVVYYSGLTTVLLSSTWGTMFFFFLCILTVAIPFACFVSDVAGSLFIIPNER